MKKFKCTVTKETTMEVEIDDSVWTDEEIAEWQKHFYNADSLKDIATHIAKMKTEYDDGDFIEGFGIPLINGKKPYDYLKDDDINKSINICNQSSDIDVDVDEIIL